MNPEDEELEEGYEWVEAWEPVSLPEFVEQSAKGEMKMIDGKIHVKAPVENTDNYYDAPVENTDNYYDDYWNYQQDEEPEEPPISYKDKHGR